MYQKTRFSHKYLIISIDIDFIRFCFPFFYIRWLMGYDNTIRRNSIYKLYCTLSQITFRVDATLHVEDWDVIHQHSGI